MNNKCCSLITKEWKKGIEIEAEEANEKVVFPKGLPRNKCEELCKLTKNEEKIIEMNYSRENVVPFFEELIKVLFSNKKKYDSKEFAVDVSGKAMALLIKDCFSSIGEFEESKEELAMTGGPLVYIDIDKEANSESSFSETSKKIKECLELAFWKISFIAIGAKSKEDEGWFLEFDFPNEEVENKGIVHLTIRDDTDTFRHWCDLHQEIALLLKKWNTK